MLQHMMYQAWKCFFFYQDFWHSFKTCLTVPDSNKGNVLNFLELKIWTFDNVTQSARVLVTNIRASALVGEAPHKQNTDRECQSNSENQQHQLCTTQELCNHRSLTGVFRQKNNDNRWRGEAEDSAQQCHWSTHAHHHYQYCFLQILGLNKILNWLFKLQKIFLIQSNWELNLRLKIILFFPFNHNLKRWSHPILFTHLLKCFCEKDSSNFKDAGNVSLHYSGTKI